MTQTLLGFLSLLALLAAGANPNTDDFLYPNSIAVDRRGNIYVGDREASAVFRLSPEGGGLTVVARGESKPGNPFYHLAGLAVTPDGEIAISSPSKADVYWVRGDAALPVGVNSAESPFAKPQGLAPEGSRNLIVADLGRQAVFRVAAGQVSKITSVPLPTGACVDRAGNIVIVSAARRRLVRIDRQGKLTEIAAGAPLELPLSAATYPDGTYVVADGYAKALFKVSRGAKPKAFIQGPPLQHPSGVAVAPDGSTLVVDPQARAVFRVNAAGKISVLHSAK